MQYAYIIMDETKPGIIGTSSSSGDKCFKIYSKLNPCELN